MDSPLEPSKFNLTTEDGKTKFYMTAQAELFNAMSNLEETIPDITSIIHSIDVQLSPNEQLLSIDKILYKYILSWQALHLYFQELLKIRKLEVEKYY
jgi:hypothetical protein